MGLRRIYSEWYGILRNPETGFARFNALSLEQVLAEYMKLLLLAAVGAGTFLLLKTLLWALAYTLVFDVQVQYLRLINYGLGGTIALFFLYLFAGTFLLFLASMLVRPFQRLPYADLVKLLLIALAPCVVFGWFVPAAPALLLWSLILTCVGYPVLLRARSRKKGTIGERE